MTGPTEHNPNEADDAGIEELLRQVGARDEPSQDVMREVHSAVHAEWIAMVNERCRRRRTMAWGIATSLAVAAVIAMFGLFTRSGTTPTMTVAHIDGRLLADAGNGRWNPRTAGQHIAVGESLQTDDRSRAAVTVGEGLSLRLDRNTTVRVVSADRVILGSGALYVDLPAEASGNTALTVQASAGSVRHVGTQYQVRTHVDDIEVSVREGRVLITNAAGTSTGEAGERIRMTSGGEVTRTTVSPRDPDWQWAVNAAPPFDINDRSLTSFLQWIARETGRELIYSSPQVQAAAAQVKLRGSIAGLDLDTALTAVLSTTQLRRFETKDEFIGITLQ